MRCQVVDFMYICICNAITDRQIREAVESGVTDLRGLRRTLGVASGCGSCKEYAAELLRESRQRKGAVQPTTYVPAIA